jgi:hypothetical protein
VRDLGKLAENNKKTAKCKPRGKPFEKGVSGNPGGRPSKLQEIKELTENLSVPCINEAFKIVNNKYSKDSDKLKAIELIVAYGVGKPTQPIDANINGQLEFVVVIDE